MISYKGVMGMISYHREEEEEAIMNSKDDGEAVMISVAEADHLEQDALIRGQRFACVSFISPKDAIAAKDAYTTTRFLKSLSSDIADTFNNLETIFEGHSAVSTMIRMLRERHAYLWEIGRASCRERVCLYV